jgi:glycosyltransferase involved in cell wall biosynthesis
LKRPKVICVHIGARSHYLLPSAIEASGNLDALITDTWIRSNLLRFLLTKVPLRTLRSLAGRYTSCISSNKVTSFGLYFLLFEFYLRVRYTYSWTLVLKRDAIFQRLALKKIKRATSHQHVFAISYTALECFKIAKLKGMKTILFQVDPGLEEERIISQLVLKYPSKTTWEPAPNQYWENWKMECDLADLIMVNSTWSKKGLIQQGVQEKKISIIPLPFTLLKKHTDFIRTYPVAFTKQRPLRCLFLGTLSYRKGIHLILQAAKALQQLPIEFICVGRSEIPTDFGDCPNVLYSGIVTREETDSFYKDADVFLFPTLSDGFGLTQLEAMAWKLPVIATDYCGDVVEHAKNGWKIDPRDRTEMEILLTRLVADPDQLNNCAAHCLETVILFNTAKFTKDIAMLL